MKIAIVGASGAVGQEFLRILEERPLPVDELLLFGSERSAGQTYMFRGKPVTVKLLRHNDDFRGVDIAPHVGRSGHVARIRRDDHPPRNADDRQFERLPHGARRTAGRARSQRTRRARRPRRIIANPNCTTIQMVVALQAIERVSHIRRVHVATYQSASGAGAQAMAELERQYADLAEGREPKVEKFAYQLAYNVIPHIDVFTDNDYTKGGDEDVPRDAQDHALRHRGVGHLRARTRDACPQRKHLARNGASRSRPTRRAAFEAAEGSS